MSMFSVEDNVLNEISSQLDAIAKEIRNQESQLRRVQNGIYSSKSLHNKGYVTKVSNLKNSVSKIENTVSDLSTRLNKIAETYRQYENRVVKEGNGKAKGKGAKWDSIKAKMEKAGHSLKELLKHARMASGALGCDLAGAFSKDPVNLTNGNYVYEDEYLQVNSPIPWKFRVFYNSQNLTVRNLGKGWSNSLDIYLEDKDNSCIIFMDDASQIRFYKMDDEFIPLAGATGVLRWENGQFLYTDREGILYHFDSAGKIISKENLTGYKIEYQYEKNTLVRVADSYKNELNLSYENEKLVSIEDQIGREITICYENDLLSSITDTRNNTIRYEYDESENLIRITDAEGVVVLANEYDAQRRTVKQTFPDNGTVLYDYDDQNNHVIMTQQNGSKIVYEHDDLMRATKTIYEDGVEEKTYNNDNYVTSYTDKNGNTTTYDYDENGNAISIINPLGEEINIDFNSSNKMEELRLNGEHVVSVEYNDEQLITAVVNANNFSRHFTYDDIGQLISFTREDGSVTNITYNGSGDIIQVEDPVNGKVCYEYDLAHRVTKTTDALGNVTHYEYDNSDNVVAVINAEGNKEIYEYNKNNALNRIVDYNGGITTIEYNSINKISKVTYPDGISSEYKYDNMWNLISKTDSDIAETKYGYDLFGRINSIEYPNGTIEKAYYDPCGNLIKRIAPDGGEYTFEYDALNREKCGTDPMGFHWEKEYDARGNILSIRFNEEVSEKYSYDNMGNITSYTNLNGYTVFFRYDSMGNITELYDDNGWILKKEYYPGGLVKRTERVDGDTQEYIYDDSGNIVSVIDSGSGKWEYEYNSLGRVVKASHGEEVEIYSYDAVGNIVSYINANGEETKYEYGRNGLIEKIHNANGSITEYEYDVLRNVQSVTRREMDSNDSSRKISYIRDVMGNVTSIVDPNGCETQFVYDGSNRIVGRTNPDGSTINMSYNYDGTTHDVVLSDGRTVEYKYNELKQLIELRDWIGVLQYQKDSMGQIKEVIDQESNRIGYQYTDRGEVSAITYPNGQECGFQYDNLKLKSLLFDNNHIQYSYYPNGYLHEKNISDGIKTAYMYDESGRIKNLLSDVYGYHKDISYIYDNAGRISHITELDGENRKDFDYSYGYNDQLFSFSNNSQKTTFKYDAFGNRTEMIRESGYTVHYNYNNSDQLTSVIDGDLRYDYSYDLRGNVKTIDKNGAHFLDFTFDVLDRLTSVSKGSQAANYLYDGLNQRISSSYSDGNSTATHRFVYDHNAAFNNLLTHQCNELNENYFWDGTPIAKQINDQTEYLFTNELMTPYLKVDSDRNMTSFERSVFGDALDKPKDILSSDITLSFTGYLADPLSGLMYANQREYDPHIGRFISRDPLLRDSASYLAYNSYIYCENDPANNADYDGQIPIQIAAGAAWGLANVGAKFVGDVCSSVKSGHWHGSSWQSYVGSFVGGFAEGAVVTTIGTANPVAAYACGQAAGAAIEEAVTAGLSHWTGAEGYRKEDGFSWTEEGLKIVTKAWEGAAEGAVMGGVGKAWDKIMPKVPLPQSFEKGKKIVSVGRRYITRAFNHTAKRVSLKTFGKMLVAVGIVKVAQLPKQLWEALKERANNWIIEQIGSLIKGSAKCPIIDRGTNYVTV